MKKIVAISLVILCFLTSCKNSEKTKSTKNKPSLEDVVNPSKIESLLERNTHEIIVKERLAAGGYIYLKVLEKGKEYWMAVPGREVKIGATYYYDGGLETRDFESKTLKRTFESVIFAEGIRKDKNATKKVKRKVVKKVEASSVSVEKAPNGITVGELFESPKDFSNKQVIIKGQVVKVNNGIMGVNFVHLQDGTQGNGQNDITITSNAEFKVGEVVTIKGTVVLNKDFGAGYTYDVIVEKAAILN
jgi:ABC-type oligopeptide transport system substrate-binding subunit